MSKLAMTSKAWVYEEARKLLPRISGTRPIVFETGYGPSGLPHIGTFAEVARTSMVRRAFTEISGGHPSRLIVFSDDMDALRKVPDNVPQHEMMERHIGYSLTSVPDPFGEYESFAHHNNAMLRSFLDRFDFDYEFMSSTECYDSGRFNDALLVMARHYRKVEGIITPTMGEERQATYCAFMPRLPDGRIVAEGVRYDREYLSLVNFQDDIGDLCYDVRSGSGKMQWKADWALRWIALGVDYEMCGKDLIDSVKLSSKIVRACGGQPPVNMIYEMFLDEDGHKISKSLGNGITIDEWLRWGTQDSLSSFLYREPKQAKKLSPKGVAQAMDDLWDAQSRYHGQTPEQQIANPVHHVFDHVPIGGMCVSYQLLLNIAQTGRPENVEQLMRYVTRYFGIRQPEMEEHLEAMVAHAFNYYSDFLTGEIERRPASFIEANAIRVLADKIEALAPIEDAFSITDDQVMTVAYEVGKEFFGKEKLRDWFKALYQILLGQESGPRFGMFAVLSGIPETVAMLREAARGVF